MKINDRAVAQQKVVKEFKESKGYKGKTIKVIDVGDGMSIWIDLRNYVLRDKKDSILGYYHGLSQVIWDIQKKLFFNGLKEKNTLEEVVKIQKELLQKVDDLVERLEILPIQHPFDEGWIDYIEGGGLKVKLKNDKIRAKEKNE